MASVEFVEVEDGEREPRARCDGCERLVGVTDRSGYGIADEAAYGALRGRPVYLVPHDYPQGSLHQGSRCPGSGRKVGP